MIKLYTEVALTQDLPEYGLKKGDTAIVIEHYPMPEGQEDGYSLEGFDIRPVRNIISSLKCLHDKRYKEYNLFLMSYSFSSDLN